MIYVILLVALREIRAPASETGSPQSTDADGQSRGSCNSSAGRYSRFAEGFQTADLSARKLLDELGVSR
jgi:hypothetical protein